LILYDPWSPFVHTASSAPESSSTADDDLRRFGQGKAETNYMANL